jgi:hypothetical protein
MKQLGILTAFLVILTAPSVSSAEHLRAILIGYREVPSVSTRARGEFRAQMSPDEQSINYTLTYSGLQGNVTQAHIHVAQRSVNGSIVIWLCGTGDPTAARHEPDDTQTCPQEGTISGTITAADVVAGSMTSQQLAAGDLAAVIAAIRGGVAYTNVHTDLSPGGERRSQIKVLRP